MNIKTLRYYALVAITALTALFFTACGDDDPVDTGSEKDANIVSFTFTGIVGNAAINSTARTVTAVAGSTVNLTNLAPSFTLSTNATAKVGTVAQSSGVTQNDFTAPVVYAITSGDGTNTQNWTVTITQGDAVITDLTSDMINKTDAILAPGVYICKDYLTLNSGNTLTISPGVTIKFEAGISITAENNATIKAKGTAALPILFTSNRSDKKPGDWYGIGIYQDGSEFEYCTFEYGSGYGDWAYTGMLRLNNCKASVKNCTFRNAKFSGVYLDGELAGFTAFDNNTITNCGENEDNAYPIKADGGIATLAGLGTGNTITTAKGIGVNGGTVVKSMTLKKFPYIFYDGVIVESGSGSAILTVEAGAKLTFAKDFGIDVGNSGKLIAQGTASDKITFTATSGAKGGWKGIGFNGGALDGSILENCDILYGGGGNTWSSDGNITCQGTSEDQVTIKNCNITNSKGYGIFFVDENSKATMSGNTFSGNTKGDTGTGE